MILPGIDCSTASVMSERLRRTVEEALSGDLAITISVGYACLSRGDFENAEKFFEAADSALYRAKQARAQLRGRRSTIGIQQEQEPPVQRAAIS